MSSRPTISTVHRKKDVFLFWTSQIQVSYRSIQSFFSVPGIYFLSKSSETPLTKVYSRTADINLLPVVSVQKSENHIISIGDKLYIEKQFAK